MSSGHVGRDRHSLPPSPSEGPIPDGGGASLGVQLERLSPNGHLGSVGGVEGGVAGGDEAGDQDSAAGGAHALLRIGVEDPHLLSGGPQVGTSLFGALLGIGEVEHLVGGPVGLAIEDLEGPHAVQGPPAAEREEE